MALPFERGALVQYSRSGPIPLAAELADYERAIPGLGREIADEAHANMRSDRKINELAVETATTLDKRGQIYAFLLSLICIAMCFTCLFFLEGGKAIAGATLFGLGAAGPVVNSFLQRKGNDGPPPAPPLDLD
ncbi:hypothetical protein [Rhodococcus qingshengii]|uniref:hypothetical protein n=1 Tax=Rhodococcus qingshengii TaxID=334542 RepID=UPI001C8C625A|nr:hypothetical protein [Rhodococcus qingshengii]MBX9147762.1 hypothetical protein [Rhodococcus qingshengii]